MWHVPIQMSCTIILSNGNDARDDAFIVVGMFTGKKVRFIEASAGSRYISSGALYVMMVAHRFNSCDVGA